MKQRTRRILTYNIGDQEFAEDVTNNPYSNRDIIRILYENDMAEQLGERVKKLVNLDSSSLVIGQTIKNIKIKKSRILEAKIEFL